jgi:hypothetical protein
MDLSDLPEAARNRIAAAEIEADSILANFHDTANQLAAEADRLGVDPSDIGYSPGNIPLDLARQKFTDGRDQAAAHLFGVTAGEYLKHGKPDTEGFDAKLEAIGDWIFQKFHPNRSVLDEMKSICRALALRRRAAALEATEGAESATEGGFATPKEPASSRVATTERNAAPRRYPKRVGGDTNQGIAGGAMEPDTESARLEAAYKRLEAALSPELWAELRASLVELAKNLEQSKIYQKNLLQRLGVRTNLDDREEFYLQLWAAARYVGFSDKEFWCLEPRELCAVLELKARELELSAGAADSIFRPDPGGDTAPKSVETASAQPQRATIPNSKGQAATEVFERQPGYEKAQVWLSKRMEKVCKAAGPESSLAIGSSARATLVLKLFDVRAEAYLRLVVSIETQNAFVVMLDFFEILAWEEFVGGYPTSVRPGAPSIDQQIGERKRHWIRKGYERLEAHALDKRRSVGSKTSRVTAPVPMAEEIGAAEPSAPIAAGSGYTRPGGHPAVRKGESTEPWHMRLRAARAKAKLSRTGTVQKLKAKGIQITADAIKKHEEGVAMPRPDVRKAYALIYELTEDQLFPPGE